MIRNLFNRVLPASLWILLVASSLTTLSKALAGGTSWLMSGRYAINALFLMVMALLFMLRRFPNGPRARPIEALVAVAGTVAPVLIVSSPVTSPTPTMLVVGSGLVLIGLLWATVALVALGRCFGILPEVRGLVMRGPYRLVRHPVYLGEIVSTTGLLLPVLSPLTALAWVMAAGLQIWRSVNEERALSAVFPEYSEYQMRTRRLIPLVW